MFEIDRSITACFSGYRPAKLPWRGNEDDPRCKLLKLRLMMAAFHSYEHGYRNFICGMAQGVDLYAAEAVMTIGESVPSVKLICAIPYEGHVDMQSAAARKRYGQILNKAVAVITLSDNYNAQCMLRRNRFMVDNSARLIAVYDGASGGTQNTIAYAQKRGLDICIIAPDGETAP